MIREKRSCESSSVRRPVTDVCEKQCERGGSRVRGSAEATDGAEDGDGCLARLKRASSGRQPNLLAFCRGQLQADLVDSHVLSC